MTKSLDSDRANLLLSESRPYYSNERKVDAYLADTKKEQNYLVEYMPESGRCQRYGLNNFMGSYS
jgi:hypothetical protein